MSAPYAFLCGVAAGFLLRYALPEQSMPRRLALVIAVVLVARVVTS